MTRTRIITALILAFVLSGAAVSRAQIPVTDVLALAEHIVDVALQETIKVVRQSQAELTYKMSLRLSTWVSLARYVIDAENMPEWRIHCWFAECGNLFANDYLQALTYGDPSGAGYDSVTVTRLDPSPAFSTGYTPEAQAILRSQLGTLDLIDSSIVRASHTAGQHRFGGRTEAEALIALQDMVTDEDREQSLAAVLDKVSAASIVELQNKQTRAALETAILEQLVVEQTVAREADVELSNMMLTKLRADADDEDRPPSVVDHATDALRNWRLR
jgi:ACT domain-containing protein